jgi:hypothetical protein
MKIWFIFASILLTFFSLAHKLQRPSFLKTIVNMCRLNLVTSQFWNDVQLFCYTKTYILNMSTARCMHLVTSQVCIISTAAARISSSPRSVHHNPSSIMFWICILQDVCIWTFTLQERTRAFETEPVVISGENKWGIGFISSHFLCLELWICKKLEYFLWFTHFSFYLVYF